MLVASEHEGVTRLKLSRFPDTTPVSAYLVDGLLVDTGLAYTAEELAEFLQTRDVMVVVNTHYHEDHIGGNHLIQKMPSVQIFAHRLAVEKIDRRPELYPYQEEVWGYPVPTRVNVIGESISTGSHDFEVVHTPGHSPDHICLFERRRGWLFSGDLFHSTHPRVARPEENQRKIIESLRRVRELQPRILFPAPTEVVTDAEKVLNETIVYLEKLGERIKQCKTRSLSAIEIRQEIFGAEYPIAAMTQEQFSHLNLILGFLKDED